jgi:hypothetical protein
VNSQVLITEAFMLEKPASYLPGGPFKAWQLAAFFVPFLLPVAEAVRKLGWLPPAHPAWSVLIFTLVALWLLVFAASLVRAFPAWTLPAAGMVLFLIGFLIKGMVRVLVLTFANLPNGFAWPESISQRISLMLLSDLFFLVPMLLFLAFIVMAAPPFRERVRQDGLLLSLLIYGMALPLLVVYDEYQGRGIYELIGALILIAGAALFLVLRSRRLKALALALAVLLSASVLSYGLYSIFPDQYFADAVAPFRLWEAIQPLLEIPALLVLLCLPLSLSRLPVFRGLLQANP